MDFGAWSAAVLGTKWLLHLTVAAAIGAPACAWLLAREAGAGWRQRTLRHALAACIAGGVTCALHFLMLLGDFARAGLGGLLDRQLAAMLWDSPVGTALMLRLAGFAAIAAACLCGSGRSGLGREPVRGQARSYVAIVSWLAGATLLAASFAIGGHAVERGLVAQLALALHVLAMALWIGALVPLLQACRGLDTAALHATMARFGRVATAPVALLIACGLLLVALLIESPRALLDGPWSLTLGAKLIAVCTMLLLAALHRWRLVPALRTAPGVAALHRSIAAESILAGVVLAATAVLATAFGPAGM